MTAERTEPHGPQNPTTPERPNLNLVDINASNRNDINNSNRNDNANNNRNDNANNNRNDNANNNRNDNFNANNNNNRNDNNNNNRNDNNNRNSNDNRSNARSDSRSSSSSQGGSVNDSSKTTYYGGSASAPNVYSSGFCSEGGSAGFYVLGVGVSGGKTTINESCMKKEDFFRTMTQVCRSSDEKAQVALQGFDLQLKAGRELSDNPMANSVGMSAKKIADAKASVSLQLDSVCTTMATTADSTLDAMKRAGLDKPIIIPAEANNAADQAKIDQAVADKLDQIDKRVKRVEDQSTTIVIQNDIYNKVEVQQPKPVHRPPQPHKPAPPKVETKADDCKDDPKKK